jgi:hypothetical protein
LWVKVIQELLGAFDIGAHKLIEESFIKVLVGGFKDYSSPIATP